MKFHHELGHPESIAQTIATNKGYWICNKCEYIYNPDGYRYTHLLVVDETLTQGEYDRLKKDTCIICRMKETRKALGMNTAQVGKICGVSARTVEDWEQNRFFPSKPATMLLAAWLKEKETKMKKTFKLETIDQCEQVKEYWGDSVVDWDKVSKTVTVEAEEAEIQDYLNNQNEIHGWD